MEEHIIKVRYLCNFIGLYKTLNIATPAISRVLAPLEEVTAEISSSNPITWNHFLSIRLREAKSIINQVHTLYLPHPNEQLVIKIDAAKNIQGIGHRINSIKGMELVPV